MVGAVDGNPGVIGLDPGKLLVPFNPYIIEESTEVIELAMDAGWFRK